MTLRQFAAGFLALCCAIGAIALAGHKPPTLPPVIATGKPPVSWPDYSVTGPGLVAPSTPDGALVAYGYKLVAATYEVVGPDSDKPFAGNRLACQNCHLDGGTRRTGVPLVGVFRTYPKFSARSGRDISLAERIDECMTRSMNGRPLPPDSREMNALLAFMRFIGDPEAMHAAPSPPPPQPASAERGAAVHERVCAQCHRLDGLGQRKGMGYAFPPLWGPDSFNDGAGMDRFERAVGFIRHNMPRGVDPANPQLTLQEAWDVAAYLQSMPRPRYEAR
jgi:thiosulfate dehydrogenase